MSISWLAPIIVFGLVVFVHELGHFIAAKAFGVYAPRFSIGFGPALLKWRRGETEYKLAAFPLGGYVRMASRLDETSAMLEGGPESAAELPKDYDPNAMIPFGPKPIPEHRWFESKSLPKRLVIMLAGVTMNMVLGWFINIGIATFYVDHLTTKVSDVVANKPAAKAGFQKGDSIIAVNGTPVTLWDSVYAKIAASPGHPVTFNVIRHGTPLTLTATPAETTVTNLAGKPERIGRIGLQAGLVSERAPIGEAIKNGTHTTVSMATLVFTALKGLATRETKVSELGGPIAIAQTSVQAAQAGFEYLLSLVALISVNLAIFNLLPIPILDGGQIVVQVIESARGRPLTDQTREYVARAGLAFILLLFLTVNFNDIRRLFTH
jgi:regulator of sigma E protease